MKFIKNVMNFIFYVFGLTPKGGWMLFMRNETANRLGEKQQ